MKDKCWLVDAKSKILKSAYEIQETSRQLIAAQPFTVSLKTVMVADDLDGWPRGKNDLLLTTSSSLGESPLVRRVHFYGDEIKAGTILQGFYAENMFVCKDYSAKDSLWIEFNILEMDADTGSRKALATAFGKMASVAGAVFPVAMPYAALASGLAQAIDKVISALEKNKSAIECSLAFYPPDRPEAGMPLQAGTFVVFPEAVDGTEYMIESNITLKRVDNTPVKIAYAIFTVETEDSISPSWVISQKVATLLTQIKFGNDNTAAGTIDFLTDTLQQYSNFKDLKRLVELKSKDAAELTKEEKALMDQIGKREELKPFITK